VSSPMYDQPIHLGILVDAKGDGPVPEDEAVEQMCWCGDRECEISPPQPYIKEQ
jgi:hypothetical protein